MKRWTIVPVIAFGVFAGGAMGISLGQFDDFEDGTTMSWQQGAPSPNQPMVLTEGMNEYVQNISNGGGGPGSRMAMYNRAQWAGDYLSAGVSSISLDIRNAGASPMNIRLAFQGIGGSRAATNAAVALAVGDGWTSVTFDLADMTVVAGADSLADIMSSVFEFRIISADAVGFHADPIAAVLDVDNIRAIPAPGGAVVLAFGAVAAGRRRRRG